MEHLDLKTTRFYAYLKENVSRENLETLAGIGNARGHPMPEQMATMLYAKFASELWPMMKESARRQETEFWYFLGDVYAWYFPMEEIPSQEHVETTIVRRVAEECAEEILEVKHD